MRDPVSVYVAVDGSERKSKSQKEKQEEFGEGWITGGGGAAEILRRGIFLSPL